MRRTGSTRPATSRPDGALAHPSAVTLFVASPELPSEVQAAKYFGRRNFNQMIDLNFIIFVVESIIRRG